MKILKRAAKGKEPEPGKEEPEVGEEGEEGEEGKRGNNLKN